MKVWQRIVEVIQTQERHAWSILIADLRFGQYICDLLVSRYLLQSYHYFSYQIAHVVDFQVDVLRLCWGLSFGNYLYVFQHIEENVGWWQRIFFLRLFMEHLSIQLLHPRNLFLLRLIKKHISFHRMKEQKLFVSLNSNIFVIRCCALETYCEMSAFHITRTLGIKGIT